MERLLTIDASVLVSALSSVEVAHQASFSFIESLDTRKCLVVLPTLVRPEVAGAIVRITGDSDAAQRAARFAFLPVPASFVALDDKLAAEAAELATAARLRGADAVYAAVARRYDATLVTLDGALREKLPSAIACRLPQEL
jgi:predicted nucleic acid-binding protein